MERKASISSKYTTEFQNNCLTNTWDDVALVPCRFKISFHFVFHKIKQQVENEKMEKIQDVWIPSQILQSYVTFLGTTFIQLRGIYFI